MEDGKMDAEELCEVLCQDGHVDECPKKELRREEQLEQTILIVRQEEAHEGYLKKRGDEMEPGDGVETPINTAEPVNLWRVELDNGQHIIIENELNAKQMAGLLMDQMGGGYVYDEKSVVPVRRIVSAEIIEQRGEAIQKTWGFRTNRERD